jgi:hypothetical protein
MNLNKNYILKRVIAQIERREETIKNSAERSRDASNNAPGRMESRYDSTKMEHGYLADSLNFARVEIQGGLEILSGFSLPEDNKKISLGSLVEIQSHDGIKMKVFILPYGGGETVEEEEEEITIITPESPIGREIMGKDAGYQFILPTKRKPISYRISEIK